VESPELLSQLGRSDLERTRLRIEASCRIAEQVMSRGYIEECAQSVRIRLRQLPRAAHFGPDGLILYVERNDEKRRGKYDLAANIKQSQEEYVSRYAGMTELSRQRKGQLEQLMESARRDGVRTALWITPIHPRVVDVLSARSRYRQVLQETRSYFLELQGRFGVEVRDFSEPASFGGAESDWWDGAHTNEEGARKITRLLIQSLQSNGF